MDYTSQVSFLGKNPWQSHGFARARAIIRQIANDPDRCLVVIDPRRSETADKADYHLAVKPGTDAWLMAAMVGLLVQNGCVQVARGRALASSTRCPSCWS